MRNKIDINKSNYETFVVDFLEGKLTTHEADKFMDFLETNPEIAEEIDGLVEVVIEPDSNTFKSKDLLKKKSIVSVSGISEDNYEELFIASHENDITSAEKTNLNQFLSLNPELVNEYKITGQLFIEADANITFENKSQLRRKKKIAPYWYSSAAAAVLILLSIWFFNNSEIQPNRDTYNEVSTLKSIKASSIQENESIISYNIPKRSMDNNITPMVQFENPKEVTTIASLSPRNNNTELLDISEFRRILTKDNELPSSMFSEDLALNNISEEPKPKKKRSLFASVIKNQWNKIVPEGTDSKSDEKSSNDPTYVQVLDTGIKVFNTITGSETYTSKSYNSEGVLTGYQIEGRDVILSRETPSGSSH